MSKRFIGSRQTTIGREIELSGTGVHSGAPVSMVLHPAEADTGYRFLVSKRGRIIAEIPADVRYVKNLTLCTVLGDDSGVTIGTVEHLLAALRGLSIDNCYIEIDAREVPDHGRQRRRPSSRRSTRSASASCRQPRKFIKVLKPIRVEEGDCWGELTPHSSFHLDVEIDFPTPLIGRQRYGAGDELGRVPQRDLPRPHVRLHARRGEPLEGRAWRSAPRSTTPSRWPTTAS